MSKVINQNDLMDVINSISEVSDDVVNMINELSAKISKIKEVDSAKISSFKTTINEVGIIFGNIIKVLDSIKINDNYTKNIKHIESVFKSYFEFIEIYILYSQKLFMSSPINMSPVMEKYIKDIINFIEIIDKMNGVKMSSKILLKFTLIKFWIKSLTRFIENINEMIGGVMSGATSILNSSVIKFYSNIFNNIHGIFECIFSIKLNPFFFIRLRLIRKRFKKLNRFIKSISNIMDISTIMQMVKLPIFNKIIFKSLSNIVDTFRLINEIKIPTGMGIKIFFFKVYFRKIIRLTKYLSKKLKFINTAAIIKSLIFTHLMRSVINGLVSVAFVIKSVKINHLLGGRIKLFMLRRFIKPLIKLIYKYNSINFALKFISLRNIIANSIKTTLLLHAIKSAINTIRIIKVGAVAFIKIFLIKKALRGIYNILHFIKHMSITKRINKNISKINNLLNIINHIFRKLTKMTKYILIGSIALVILFGSIKLLKTFITRVDSLVKSMKRKVTRKTFTTLHKIKKVLKSITKLMKQAMKVAILASVATVALAVIVIFLLELAIVMYTIKVILGIASKIKGVIKSIAKIILIMVILAALVVAVTVVGVLAVVGCIGAAALIVFSVLMMVVVALIIALGFIGNFAWSAIPGLLGILVVVAIVGIMIWGLIKLIDMFVSLDLTMLVENVQHLMDSIDVIVNSIFKKNDKVDNIKEEDNESGWFSEIINSGFVQGIVKIAKIAFSVPALLCTLVVVGLLGLIASSLNKINEFKVDNNIKEKVKSVLNTSSDIANMILNDEDGIVSSLKTIDNKTIEKFENYDKIFGIIAGLSEKKWGAIDGTVVENNKKLTDNYIQFVEKINTTDITKLETAAKMFEKMANFSKSIHGNFEKLAESINEDLMPVLEELKDTLNKIPEKIDTNAASVSQSISANAPISNQPSTQQSMTAQVQRENPNMSKEEVKKMVDNRLNEQARAQSQSLESKFDELIELLKSGLTRVTLT